MRTLLTTFPDELSAHALKILLEENNIRCLLKPSPIGEALLGGFGVHTGPTEIWVKEEDQEKAASLL
jgi:hypothetical protein